MRYKAAKVDRMYGIPLLFALAVIPLLTTMGVYQSGIGDYTWASGHFFYDFFLVMKSRALMITGILVSLLLGYRLYSGKRGPWTKGQKAGLILAGVFLVMSFLSALSAKERMDAFFGGYEQMEGFLVIVAYIACFCFTCLYATDEGWVSMLLHALLVGSFILSLLGALQVFGIDYLTSKGTLPFFTMFMDNPPENGITASFGEGVAYATLYNPNYVGSYVALVLPVTVLLGLWEKKMVFRLMAVLSSVLQLLMLVGAQSMTGVLGVAAGAFFALLFLFADIKKNCRVLIGISAAGIVAVFFLFLFVPDFLNRFTNSTISSCSNRISSMVTSEDSLKVNLDTGKTLTWKWKWEGTIFDFDVLEEGEVPLELTGDAFNGVGIAGEEYSDIQMTATKAELKEDEETRYYDVLRITVADKYYWDFAKIDGSFRYINRVKKPDGIHKVDSFGFEGHYDLATNRGYIWSRTIPLLKETVFLGVGPDQFVYAFPNDDYVGKVNCGFDGQHITKPHNMYMQIWVQDGMPACLALLALYFIFAVNTFRRCFRKGRLSYREKVNIAVFCGVTGYMAAGLANDSTICVAPVFWILLGLGYSITASENVDTN